jgi:peroxiredoxin
MKNLNQAIVLLAGLAVAGASFAQAVVGQAAPSFAGVDTAGMAVSLADHKGKYVVLEWVNPECPFVQKHYNSGNMPATQKHAASKGVVWISVQTSGSAKDAKLAADLTAYMKTKNGAPTAMLMDDGKIGRAYAAKTTPHMYLIDPAGKLVYAGAIDSKASSNPADIASATNYVNAAIDEVMSGKPISRPVTQPYGCTVKYGAS